MRSGIVGFGLAVAAMVVLTGCSGGTTGGGSTTTGSSAAATTTAAAPTVATPVDITKFDQNPCSGLSTAQLTSLGVKDKTGNPANSSNPAHIVTCGWLTSDNKGVTVGYSTTSGLSYWYSTGGSPRRLPDIDGQPALAVPVTGRSDACAVAVGASETSFYEGLAAEVTSGDPCAFAQQIATAMTQTIKSGS